MLIKNIHEFCKLYKINIPLYSEFDYYINSLQKSEEHKKLPDLIALFQDMEDKVKDVGAYKMKVLADLIEAIKNTQAYANLQATDLPKAQPRVKDYPQHYLDTYTFFSFDIKQANYTVVRYFDDDEFPETWEQFCELQGVHQAIAESKSFRQMVFGHLNPKRIARCQSAFVKQLIEEADVDSALVFVSPDEFVIKMEKHKWDIPSVCKRFSFLGMDIRNWLNNGNPKELYKITPFEMSHIMENGKDREYRVQRIFDTSGEYLYTKLFCVPGSKYHMYFKSHVLGERLDQRDLYFYHEQLLAQWVY